MKGEMSMKRTVQAALMALTLATTASMAHAGGGGAGGIGDTFMFDCYLINGANPPHVLSVTDDLAPDGRTGVKLGKAKLLCTPATGIVTSGHDLRSGLSEAVDFQCYEASPGANIKADVQVTDPFGTDTVKAGPSRYLCVGAITCPVGETCPAP